MENINSNALTFVEGTEASCKYENITTSEKSEAAPSCSWLSLPAEALFEVYRGVVIRST